MTKKVKFLIGGTQKGGTSALAAMLNQHPNIYIPVKKELHFFNKPAYFRLDCFASVRKIISIAYERKFRDSPGAICGEATPSYMHWESAPANVWRYNPDMKWIIILRHPVYRAYSAWAMNVKRGIEDLPFDEALAREPERARRKAPYQLSDKAYIDKGIYSPQIRRLLRIFGPEQLLFLTNRELRTSSKEQLQRISQFLGINQDFDFGEKNVRVGKYEQSLDRKAYSKSLDLFRQDIQSTSKLIETDFSSWLDPDYIESNATI